MPIFWSTNVFHKISELLTERGEDFIFILHRVLLTVSPIRHCA